MRKLVTPPGKRLLKDLSLYVSVENIVWKDMFPNCR